MVLLGYSGAWKKLIHEKKFKLKISCQTPFKAVFYYQLNCTHPATSVTVLELVLVTGVGIYPNSCSEI